MGMVTVVVPPVLRAFLAGEARVSVSAITLREALEGLSARSAPLHSKLFDETGAVNRFVRVFVDGRAVVGTGAGEQQLASGTVVTILLALAGG